MGDPTLVVGMGDLLAPEYTGGSLDLDELERQFMGTRPRAQDPEKKLRADLAATARELGMDFGDLTPREGAAGTPLNSAPATPMVARTPPPRADSPRVDNYSSTRTDSPRDSFGLSYTSPQQSPRSFANITEEQEHRQHISSVMSRMQTPTVSFDAEKEHDEKLMLLAEIDELKSQLSATGIDISTVSQVSPNHPMDDIKTVRNILRLKDDRNKYCMLANEMILLGAHAVEELFDGKRVWFGKYRPNMEGWHNHVQVKLRRIQYDLSNFTTSVVHDYNISPAARLLMELIPSAILYSRQKSSQYSQPFLNDRPLGGGMDNLTDDS